MHLQRDFIARYILSLIIVFNFTGCATHTATLMDRSDVYTQTKLLEAQEIALADFRDGRADKDKIGQISMLSLKSSNPINQVLTNRIAGRLKDSGYNVKKVSIPSLDASSVAEGLSQTESVALLTGTIDDFFVSSSDALLEKASGSAHYYVKIFNRGGNIIYEAQHSVVTQYYIGLTGQFGSEKAIEMTLKECVDELFKDQQFLIAIKKAANR